MSSYDRVDFVLEQNHGYITSKDARNIGVDNKTLQRMVSSGMIERVAHGLYIDVEIFPDPFYVTQYRCPKSVFSHETALFLHNLSDRNPLRLMMTISSGWNTRLLKEEDMLFFYCDPKRMNYGLCEIETQSRVKVKAYDVERTLCDCLRSIDRLDRDLVLTGLKRYLRRSSRDNAKLLDYAATFKIRDIVYRYLEVLV